MATYEELKVELKSIAEIVERFPEPIKPRVFEILVSKFLGGVPEIEIPGNKEKPSTPTGTQQPKKPKKAVAESYTIDKNLNLRGGSGTASFKEFYSQKSPKAALEFNAVAAYYLSQTLGLEKITPDQIYTCYKEVNFKPPGFFKQSLVDTKNQKGWIDISDDDTVTIPHRGVAFVDHDLPKKSTKKGKDTA